MEPRTFITVQELASCLYPEPDESTPTLNFIQWVFLISGFQQFTDVFRNFGLKFKLCLANFVLFTLCNHVNSHYSVRVIV